MAHSKSRDDTGDTDTKYRNNWKFIYNSTDWYWKIMLGCILGISLYESIIKQNKNISVGT